MHSVSPVIRRRPVLAGALLALALAACNGSSYDAPSPTAPAPTPAPAPAPMAEPQPATARYRVTFEATWSRSSHPTDFPDNPHFSPLVGSTHRDGAAFWAPGGIASQGIEDMAEKGATSPLDRMIEAQIASGSAEHLLLGEPIGRSPGSTSLELEVSQEFSRVTLVSMVAPSPDWFVGVQGLDLFDGEVWAESVTVDLPPLDAGTDRGPTFTSPDDDAVPQEPIALLTGPPVEWNGAVAPMGTFTFERLDG